MSSIPGSGRSPEGGNGNPLQYSFFLILIKNFLKLEDNYFTVL